MRPAWTVLLAFTAVACADAVETSGARQPHAWVVSETETGPLVVGMTLAEVNRVLGAKLQAAGEMMNGCDMLEVPGGPLGLSIMIVDDTLVRFDVVDSVTRNAHGLSVSSTEAEVRAVYGSRLIVEPHAYDGPAAHYLIVRTGRDSSYATVFETDGRRVTRYRAGRRPAAEWIEGCS